MLPGASRKHDFLATEVTAYASGAQLSCFSILRCLIPCQLPASTFALFNECALMGVCWDAEAVCISPRHSGDVWFVRVCSGKELFPTKFTDFLLSKPGDDEDKKKDALYQELKAVNDHLEKSGKPYFGGDDVCATDLSMAPTIKHVKIGADEIKVQRTDEFNDERLSKDRNVTQIGLEISAVS